jgi:CheY-like chemotaxis protein
MTFAGLKPPAFEDQAQFKVSEVASVFGVTVQTFHYWLKTGRVRKAERTSRRGIYLIPRDELVRMLSAAGREVPGLWERRRTKVLLIEDDPGVRNVVAQASRSSKFSFELRTARTVEDGLVIAARHAPDVLLLDTTFPANRMRADQGLRFLRGTKALRKMRVVALVHHPRTGEAMTRAGADGFLLKPFGLDGLRETIDPCWPARQLPAHHP